MGSWGCPHEWNGVCQRVKSIPCDPGMKGCVLYGRFVFSNPVKNPPHKCGYAGGSSHQPKPSDGDSGLE